MYFYQNWFQDTYQPNHYQTPKNQYLYSYRVVNRTCLNCIIDTSAIIIIIGIKMSIKYLFSVFINAGLRSTDGKIEIAIRVSNKDAISAETTLISRSIGQVNRTNRNIKIGFFLAVNRNIILIIGNRQFRICIRANNIYIGTIGKINTSPLETIIFGNRFISTSKIVDSIMINCQICAINRTAIERSKFI